MPVSLFLVCSLLCGCGWMWVGGYGWVGVGAWACGWVRMFLRVRLWANCGEHFTYTYIHLLMICLYTHTVPSAPYTETSGDEAVHKKQVLIEIDMDQWKVCVVCVCVCVCVCVFGALLESMEMISSLLETKHFSFSLPPLCVTHSHTRKTIISSFFSRDPLLV